MSNNDIFFPVSELAIKTIDELVKEVLASKKVNLDNLLYFRGENQDFGLTALTPLVYRSICQSKNYLHKEHIFYHEMQRFNDQEFATDKTAFDKLARMQHYQAPTRLLDMKKNGVKSSFDSCCFYF